MAVSLAQWSSGLPSPFEPCPFLPSGSRNMAHYQANAEWAMSAPKRHQHAPISLSEPSYENEPQFSIPQWRDEPDAAIRRYRPQPQPQPQRQQSQDQLQQSPHQRYREALREAYQDPSEAGFYQHPPSPTHMVRQDSCNPCMSIEPDPLPPHSSPHTLTPTQSQAFSKSAHQASVRLGKEEVRNSSTGVAEYNITRDTSNLPSFLSTKPILTIRRASTGLPVATIRFDSLASNDIEVTIHGRETSLANTGFLHKRWAFAPTTSAHSAEKWTWKKDRQTGGALLEDAKKHARVLARMKGDQLTVERSGLSNETYDEIVISAIAMVEAARRSGKSKDMADPASAVSDFVTSDGRASAREGSISPI